MNLPEITILAENFSPRLTYVLEWLFEEQLGFSVKLTTDPEKIKTSPYSISYGSTTCNLSIFKISLLDSNSIEKHDIVTKEWNGLFTLYYNDASNYTVPFDIFSGIFYLLSRYEEYLPFPADKHGRYPFERSILKTHLEVPVIDEWVSYLRKLLMEKWQLNIPKRDYYFQPTYDIDIAWSYKNKGTKRWLSAAAKEILGGQFSIFNERLRVARGKISDPYDAFDDLFQIHEKLELRPIYFILSSSTTTNYDKNISLKHPAMADLVHQLADDGEIGIHPSYLTKHDAGKFVNEKLRLQQTADQSINQSRQHYIRLFFPATYRMLLSNGITDDYTMGYATTFGFRAGTSNSFKWYDLKKETATALRIHPFCFMDTTGHYNLGLDAQAAFKRLRKMEKYIQKNGGTLCTVFHNFSLGTDAQWAGWKAEYFHFLEQEPQDYIA